MACWKFWKIPSLCTILQFKGDSMENLWWLSQPCQKNPTKSTKCNEMLANPTQSPINFLSIQSIQCHSIPIFRGKSPDPTETPWPFRTTGSAPYGPPATSKKIMPTSGKYRRPWRTWLPNRNPLVFIYSLL